MDIATFAAQVAGGFFEFYFLPPAFLPDEKRFCEIRGEEQKEIAYRNQREEAHERVWRHYEPVAKQCGAYYGNPFDFDRDEEKNPYLHVREKRCKSQQKGKLQVK